MNRTLNISSVIKFIFSVITVLFSFTSAWAEEKNTQLMINTLVRSDGYNTTVSMINAINGDLTTSGYVSRFKVGLGEYSYDSSSVQEGEVDVSAVSADAMIGYQSVTDTMKYRMYIGANYLDTQLSPSEAQSPSEGSRSGAAVYLQAMSNKWDNVYFSSSAYYSTAFDNYYSKIQLGWKFSEFTIGPEAVVLGSKSFDGQRVGLFLNGIKLAGLGWSLSGGYSLEDEENLDKNSAYVGLSVNKQF